MNGRLGGLQSQSAWFWRVTALLFFWKKTWKYFHSKIENSKPIFSLYNLQNKCASTAYHQNKGIGGKPHPKLICNIHHKGSLCSCTQSFHSCHILQLGRHVEFLMLQALTVPAHRFISDGCYNFMKCSSKAESQFHKCGTG